MRIVSLYFNRLFYRRLVRYLSFPVFVATIVRFLFTLENFVFPLYLLPGVLQNLLPSARACVGWNFLGWKFGNLEIFVSGDWLLKRLSVPCFAVLWRSLYGSERESYMF